MTQPMTDPPHPAESIELYKEQVGRWRRLWGVTFLILFGFLGLSILGYLEFAENNTKRDEQIADLEAIAKKIDDATGQEAQDQQQLVITELIKAIDCTARGAVQEALDVMADDGVLTVAVSIQRPDCPEEIP